MNTDTEIKCGKCNKLYAQLQSNTDGRRIVSVLSDGMNVRVVDMRDKVGILTCICGHETRVGLAVLGM